MMNIYLVYFNIYFILKTFFSISFKQEVNAQYYEVKI